MTELDKFKRRTIRSVARLLFQEKKQPEELWKQMKKETGTDCRVLWERMRALCVKKLNRMIAVDDRSASLPTIARLSLTDWLLVDLVLVHEDIDVIMMERPESKEFPALVELFNLVQRFEIEGKQASQLAEAWAAATVFYNRQGRQCSPMLLQRRWYQLKKLTRARFYKFWHAYRGNVRLLDEARKAMPTRLQMAIAKRYPKVIVREFPEWEKLIEERLIIMPDEFEAKMRLPNLPKPCNSNAPDLVLVEPVIETIELGGDSDPEDHNEGDIEDFSDPEKSNDATDITDPTNEEQATNNEALGVKVKTEPVEQDGLSNVQLISATHVPEVEIPDDDEKSPDVVPTIQDEIKIEDTPDVYEDDVIELPSDVPGVNNSSKIIETEEMPRKEFDESKKLTDRPPGDDDDDIIAIPSTDPIVNIDSELPHDNNTVKTTAEEPPRKNRVASDVVTLNDSDEFDDIIKIKADEYCRKSTEDVSMEKEAPSDIDILIKDKAETFLKIPNQDTSLIDKRANLGTINITNKIVESTTLDLMADLDFIDDGIEFVDDGVEFVEEDDMQKNEAQTKNGTSDGPSDQENEQSNKFDLKLLMDPVVYTTKLDQMRIFLNKEFDTVHNIEDIEMAVIESKPVSKKSLVISTKQDSVPSITGDIGDNDDLFTNKEETNESESDDEIDIVSPNSYLFKKPRTRSYDPIKLCKNPDFNTKLRRLTIGFYSSTRNRQLLNACIPMTIDLSKAFESKLFNNTLYLKSSGIAPPLVKQEVLEKQASSIIPSALPVQSLIDSTKCDIQNLISNQSPESIVSERQKVIKLPDIEKVRRINQQLLTAQVPPLRVHAGHPAKPPTSKANEFEIMKDVVPSPIPGNVTHVATNNTAVADQNTLLSVVKVKTEESVDQKDGLDSSESIPPETLPPAKEKLIKIINQAKISTQEALVKLDSGKVDDVPKPIVENKFKPKPPQENIPGRKYSWRQPRVSCAWAPKFPNAPQNLDDFLLTGDTLEKMLHLLMSGDKDGKGCNCCKAKPKKGAGKKLGRKPKTPIEETKETQTDDSVSVQDNTNSETVEKDEAPPKTPPPATIDIPDSPPPVAPKKPLARGRVVRYCCWANQKLCNRKRLTKHTCPPNECECCCRQQLANKLIEDEKRRNETNKNLAIELSDDEESIRKACESIENVVQQSREITNIGHDKLPDQQHAVIRTTTNTTFHTPSITNVSPGKVSVDVALSPTRQPAPTDSTTPPKAPNIITKLVVPPEKFNSVMNQRRPEPRFKQVIQPRLTKPPQGARCSCQKPALSQDSQRRIVIDGSKNCPFHPVPIVPKEDKVWYLHSKNIAKDPTESPIFLGKNKILLTTVKFPRKPEEVAQEPNLSQSPKIIPTLPLPAGVQLVLMPSGTVTYTLDPGVELDEAQLATLPTIISAVQEQLNMSGQVSGPIAAPQVSVAGASQANIDTSGIDLTQSEVNTVSDTTNNPQTESHIVTGTSDLPHTTDINENGQPPISLTTNEVLQDTESPPKSTNIVDIESPIIQSATQSVDASDTETVNALGTDDKVSNVTVDQEEIRDNNIVNEEPVVSSETSTVEETGLPKEIQTQETASTQDNNETVEPNDKGGNNKKNLLSDLMEMSGISAEDATVPEPAVPEPASTNSVVINTDHARNLPELSPVTSFAELKYACEQNGKFFKLDFETGVIVPINVCIKKNPRNKVIPTKTKECIDLTDDVENNTATQNPAEPKEVSNIPGPSASTFPVEYFYNGKTLSVSNVVKPVKLFKAFRPTPLVLKRSATVQPFESSLLKQTHVEKRKQSLNKVEARIDLVDSDEPMEEEYLLDSSDEDSDSNAAQPLIVESLDLSSLINSADSSDDSSDDEPLAKKFKRLKEIEAGEENVKETNIYDEIPDVPQLPEPSELTESVTKELQPIDKPLLSNDEEMKDLAPDKETSQKDVPVPVSASTDAVPALNVRTDLVPARVGSPDFNEDDDSDKDVTMPLFMSDQSDGEGDDCILGV